MIPPKENSAFVACMEDILSVYQRPYNSAFPVICMDEKPIQLLADTCLPLSMKIDNTAKFDGEYKRHGTCSIFLFTDPLSGWRRASVSTRRTRVDWANQLRILLEEDYPEAEKIVLVMDNLNTALFMRPFHLLKLLNTPNV